MTKLDIDKVAIIGAGPGGLATLYELLHTDSEGRSTVPGPKPEHRKFSQIVVFEQKDRAGGIWAPSLDKADLRVPPQQLLDEGKYNDPEVVHPARAIPSGVDKATYEHPLEVDAEKLTEELEWRRSGLFPDLFTNISSKFVRFSYLPNEEKYQNKDRTIYPFLSQSELSRRVENFISTENLNDNIRFNTRVEHAQKNDQGKWILTVVEKDPTHGKEKWYTQQFDAIVVANGHYTVPNIPFIEGLALFNKKYPGSVLQAKSYRNPDEFRNKKVVFVGNSFSTVNLVQYVAPVAKSVVVSKRGPHLVFGWINDGLNANGLVSKPEIASIDADTRIVTFKDGTTETDVDSIVLTTGYHYHLPFLRDYLKVIQPSNLSRVGGLYHSTFFIDDPTIAAVGVAVTALNFHTIEASAAAIAGVWSNAKQLPSKEEQKEWERKQVEDTANNLFFHFYPHTTVKEDFIDKLHAFAAFDRPHPLEKDNDYIEQIDLSISRSGELYYKLLNKELLVSDTRYND